MSPASYLTAPPRDAGRIIASYQSITSAARSRLQLRIMTVSRQGGNTHGADAFARRHAEGVLHPGQRRGSSQVEASRPVLRRLGRSSTQSTMKDSGLIYAAAASEWHGSAVWRSPDLGETWEHSSEGLGYRRGRAEALQGLQRRRRSWTPAGGRRGRGAVREPRRLPKTFSLLTTLDDLPGRDKWNNPDNQPPGHLGLSVILPHPTDPERLWVIVQGHSIFETTDSGETWAPRNKGLRADWPLENPEVGYCVHKLVLSPTDHDRLYQQNHVGMHRSDDAAPVLGGDQRGIADRVRVRRRRSPTRPRELLRHPA